MTRFDEPAAWAPADWSTACANCRHPRAAHGFSGAYCTWPAALGRCACIGFHPLRPQVLASFPFTEPRDGEAVCVVMPTGQLAAVRPFGYGVAMLSIDYPPTHPLARAVQGRLYFDSWKYVNVPAATAELGIWRRRMALGAEQLEPMGWLEHPASGRRTTYGGTYGG